MLFSSRLDYSRDLSRPPAAEMIVTAMVLASASSICWIYFFDRRASSQSRARHRKLAAKNE
jgi:hypothetical protein